MFMASLDATFQWTDIIMEHIKRHFKQSMGYLGSNINEKSVSRIGKSIGEQMQVTHQFDSVNEVSEDSGHHPRRTVEKNMKKVIAQLHAKNRVFNHVPGRKHSTFKKIQVNMTHGLKPSKLKEWMDEQVRKYKVFYI